MVLTASSSDLEEDLVLLWGWDWYGGLLQWLAKTVVYESCLSCHFATSVFLSVPEPIYMVYRVSKLMSLSL